MTASDAREGTLRGLAGSERAQGGPGLYGAPVGSSREQAIRDYWAGGFAHANSLPGYLVARAVTETTEEGR